MAVTPLISDYELTHLHYVTTQKRDAAENICSSPMVFIIYNDNCAYRREQYNHCIVQRREQACSQFEDCKRLFSNSQQKQQFGNCTRQQEQTINESFGKSTHDRSSETAKDCLSATVSKNSSLETVQGNESSAITVSFCNESTHARSLETAKDCSATVSKISAKSANKTITARQAYASWKPTVFFCHGNSPFHIIHNQSAGLGGAKLEETLGKLQQMFADNAKAEVSRKSAEKERHTVEQRERQAAQAAQQAILHNIHTALASIFKRVTVIEEIQQRDWQTQVQQHDKIKQIETQMLQHQQAMQQYERDALNIQAGEQNKIRQREQEPVQRHAEVFQQLHTLEKAGQQQLEKQWTETKGQDKTAPALHNELEVH